MEVVMLIVVDSLAGYGTESMIMAIAAFIKKFLCFRSVHEHVSGLCNNFDYTF